MRDYWVQITVEIKFAWSGPFHSVTSLLKLWQNEETCCAENNASRVANLVNNGETCVRSKCFWQHFSSFCQGLTLNFLTSFVATPHKCFSTTAIRRLANLLPYFLSLLFLSEKVKCFTHLVIYCCRIQNTLLVNILLACPCPSHYPPFPEYISRSVMPMLSLNGHDTSVLSYKLKLRN